MKEEYISVKEAASITGKSTRTIRRWLENGTLQFKRFPNRPNGRIYIVKTDTPTYLR